MHLMSDKNANITIPVDLNNPGQFFACCDANDQDVSRRTAFAIVQLPELRFAWSGLRTQPKFLVLTIHWVDPLEPDAVETA